MAKPYEITEYNGQPARLYEDGSIRNEKGHWLAKHPGAVDITSETAPIMRARAVALRQEAASQGIANYVMAKGAGNGLIGPTQAWAMASERLAGIVFDGEARDSIQAMRVLADVTPSKYDKSTVIQQQQAPQPAQTNVIAVFLQQLAHKESDADIIDAE